MLADIHRAVSGEDVPIARMNFVNAELTKLAVNNFLVLKVGFANSLQQMCEKLPGGNIDVISTALGLDERIGADHLGGGLWAAGTCLPRDTRAMVALAEELGTGQRLVKAIDDFNRGGLYRLASIVKQYPGPVAILGLAYKPGTDVVTESPGIQLADLLSTDRQVHIYDPVAMDNAALVCANQGITYANSLNECIGPASVVVITTPWETFRHREHLFKNQAVIDCWRILEPGRLDESVRYIGFGIGN
jgi:UDPglucose 6-dehydrogenase